MTSNFAPRGAILSAGLNIGRVRVRAQPITPSVVFSECRQLQSEVTMKSFLSITAAATAAGMLLVPAAFAQNSKHDEPAADSAAQSAPAAMQGSKSASLRQDLQNDLQHAGFSNVRVMPDSFLVQAKDKSGDPIAMIINPNSMTEIIDEGTVNEAAATQAGATNGQMASAGAFTTVPSTDRLSSKLIGTDVYNKDRQEIGTIKDIAYGPQSRVQAYIIGVGGFLGMGDHYVAVNPAALQVKYDHSSQSWQASLDTTADQLKSAPEYKYPGQG